MNESPQEIQRMDSANRLLRDVIVDLDRAVNTPTQAWTVSTRQRAMQALRAKALSAAETIGGWIEQNVQFKNVAKICGCLDSVAGNASFAGARSRESWRTRPTTRKYRTVGTIESSHRRARHGRTARQPNEVIAFKKPIQCSPCAIPLEGWSGGEARGWPSQKRKGC